MTGEYVELTAADLAHRWRERTVLESVDEAIESAGATEEYATPDSALSWLLALAWSDLESARHEAINGRWSMRCDGQVHRIVGLTRLTGPLPWEQIPVDLLLDGLYERIHEAIGTPTPLSDDDRRRAQAVKEHRACRSRHGSYGECPVIPTFEADPDDCDHGRWNPDNRQCLDCGHISPEDMP